MKTRKSPLRMLSVLLTVAVLFGVFACLPVGAKEIREGNYWYTVENGEATITKYIGEGGDVTIPSTLGGYPVTTIGEMAFCKLSVIVSSIVLPSSVKTIESGAFAFCEFQSVKLPDGLETIGERAFAGTELTSITIPASVTAIEIDAFGECVGLASITVQSGNAYYKAVNDCLIEKATGKLLRGCNDSVIPDGVKVIGRSAFSNCYDLANVVIPGSVTEIGAYAFGDCGGLIGAFIPASVKKVGANIFNSCPKLTVYCEAKKQPEGWDMDWKDNETEVIWDTDPTEAPVLGTERSFTYITAKGKSTVLSYTGDSENVTVPNTLGGYPVTEIGDMAFYRCDSMKSIKLPSSLITIGDEAFFSCDFTSITIPANVKSIGYDAFCGCKYLTSITIPASVTSIGWGAFCFCAGLKSITVQAGNPNYEAVGNCLIEKSTGTLLCGCSNSVIPNSVQTIGDYAFSECDGLTSIVIPDSVTTIGNGAFSFCHFLISVFIPDSVTEMGINVFDDCYKLTAYCEAKESPEGWYGDWLSQNLDERNARWGASSTDMPITKTEGDYTYLISNGKSTILSYNVVDSETVSVPETLGGCPVTAIGKGAFYDYNLNCFLTAVELPDSITSIGDYAFRDNRRLQTIFIPISVTEMGYSVFEYCYDLTVYCEAPSKPEGWDEDWLVFYNDTITVIWGCQPPEKPSSLGDVNGDETLNANDYMMLKRYVLHTFSLTGEQLAVADINADGDVNANDYMILKRAVLGTYKLPTE